MTKGAEVAVFFRASSLFRHSSFRASSLPNAHAIALHQFLRAVVYGQGDGEQNETNHEKSAVMNASSHHFPHLLGNDASHGVHGLEKRTQALREIGNGDPVSCAKQ